jgi:hypothetical protein
LVHEITKSNFIRAIAKTLFNRDLSSQQLKPLTLEQLIREESVIGATLFGDRPSNEHIAFFKDHHDPNSWFFYQEITDAVGVKHSVTIRYEVHPNGVLSVSDKNKTGISYEFIKGQEFDNFMLATKMYHDRVTRQLYGRKTSTDKKAA